MRPVVRFPGYYITEDGPRSGRDIRHICVTRLSDRLPKNLETFMEMRARNRAIDRSKLRQKAEPLGRLIADAIHQKLQGVDNPLANTLPPIPRVARNRKQRAKADREAPVLHDCLKWLHDRGIFAWRNNTGTAWIGDQPVTFGCPGSGDILGLTPRGQFFAVECKSPTGVQSAKQKEFEAKVRANSGIYLLVRSVEELVCGIQQHLSSGRSTSVATNDSTPLPK